MRTVTPRETPFMPKLNPLNERIKRDYARHLKAAQGKSATTVDAALKAIARFEDDTGARDFKTFRREQAIAFKDRLAETNGSRSGEVLSASTQAATLAALKDFFRWLAWQPGFKSKIHVPDVEYLNPSNRDAAIARAVKLRDFPSLDQIRAAIALMPIATVVGRRNRALMALAILTGIRDRALISLSLRHIDMSKTPPLVRQEPDSVETKFAKNISTYFFPVGDDFRQIVHEWVEELQARLLFGPNDPLFPRTKIAQDGDRSFCVAGVQAVHWADASPVRAIYKEAFARADLPYFPPHSFRHTLGHLMQTMCRTPEQIRAWSQNLGHENIATTLTSYGKIDPHRQGAVIGSISPDRDSPDAEVLARIRALVG
jgi:integrase/recombinase XerD